MRAVASRLAECDELDEHTLDILNSELEVRVSGSDVTFAVGLLPFGLTVTSENLDLDLEDHSRVFAGMLIDELKEEAGMKDFKSLAEYVKRLRDARL